MKTVKITKATAVQLGLTSTKRSTTFIYATGTLYNTRGTATQIKRVDPLQNLKDN